MAGGETTRRPRARGDQAELRAKFLILTLVLGAIVAGVGWYTRQEVTESVRASVDDRLLGNADLEARELRGWATDHREATRALSNDVLVEGTRGAAEGAWLRQREGEIHDDVESVHLVDLDKGEYVASTTATYEGKSFDAGAFEWVGGELNLTRSGDVGVTRVYERDGRRLVPFVSPVFASDLAVVVTTDVSPLVRGFDAPFEGTELQVVNDAGTVEIANEASAHDLAATLAEFEVEVAVADDAHVADDGGDERADRTGPTGDAGDGDAAADGGFEWRADRSVR